LWVLNMYLNTTTTTTPSLVSYAEQKVRLAGPQPTWKVAVDAVQPLGVPTLILTGVEVQLSESGTVMPMLSELYTTGATGIPPIETAVDPT